MKMMRFGALFLCLLAAVIANSAAATKEVRIENFAFVPASVTINVGDSVTWRQVDFTSHTSTSGQNGTPDGKWNSPFLSAGQTFSHTFAAAGTFPYFCTPHPFMEGTVIVQAATPQTPTVTITEPANNATITSNGAVKITATGTAPGSSLVMIEFYDGSSFLDMAHGEPFTINANLAVGVHSLTARATAANGQMATSAPVNITLQAPIPPATPITNPYPSLAKSDVTVEVQTIADGLASPVGLVAPNDGSGRLLIYDQVGFIYVIANGTRLAEPMLDVSSRMVALSPGYDERGLLGLALHPNFNQNGLLYTYYSAPNGEMADFMIMDAATNNHQSIIAEWKIDSANSNKVDVTSFREIMRIDQPQSNHNGGKMHFGPDGMLYVGLGDGGQADDEGNGHSPQGNAQDLNKILGKFIRIDVNGRNSANGKYGVPTDNPFVGVDGLDEIYAYGFRNPYSWSFDRLNGELMVGDVGQNMIEEVDRVFKGGNYGWRIKEGTFFFQPNGTNAGFIATNAAVANVPADLVDPIAEYDHSEGSSIIGGYVYRGSKIPGLFGKYVTGDFGTFGREANGRLLFLDRNIFRGIRVGVDDRALGVWIKGYGEDTEGELYVLGSSTLGPTGTTGKVLKLVPVTNEIAITSIRAEGTNVIVAFTGGVGPFVLEGKSSLGDAMWHTVNASSGRTITNPASGSAAFFRVSDMAGNPALGFTVSMSGAAERPNPVTTGGTGTGTLSLEGNTLHFDIRYSGLLSPATLAHIHGPAAASEFAGVQVNLAPYNGGSFGTSGTLAGSITLSPEVKAMILGGKAYVNIHTTNNPGGEIRGQIAPLVFTATMNGAAERPNAVATPGRGTATLLLVGDKLTVNAEYAGLLSSATLAHIHGPASTEVPAGVLVNLAPLNGGAFGQNGTFSGTVTLTPEQLAALIDGLTYINVHTTNNPAGEIRGQVWPASTAVALTATMNGAAERPDPVQTAGTGDAIFALQGNVLQFNLAYGGLTQPATLAHIHGPAAASQATGVLVDFRPFNGVGFNTNGTIAGHVMLSDQNRAWLLQGRTYANIHSGFKPAGEIRGQIAPVVMHAEVLGASERGSAVLTPGSARATLLLVGKQLTVASTYSGLPVTATLAHIHGPATTAVPASVMVNFAPLNGGAFGTAGSFAGTVELDPAQLAALIDELTYINTHTSNHPGGEIRGQIVR